MSLFCTDEKQATYTIGKVPVLPPLNTKGDTTGSLNIDKSMEIPIDGYITEWKFYSLYETTISLQVWRSATGTNNFELVGENNVLTSKKKKVTHKVK
jgi:hypothetical protein